MRPPTIPHAQARKLFLSLQGLADSPSRRLTREHLYDIIARLGFVQVDSICTVERAHHLTLFARNTHYRPHLLQTLMEQDQRLFEHWTHDASIIPTPWYPYWQPRFTSERRHLDHSPSWQRRLGPNAPAVLERVRQRVRQDGPMMSRDFADEREAGAGTWWGWGPSKTALEYLWRTGEFAVCQRIHFQKVYDVAEKVIPAPYRTQTPSHQEYVDWACTTALQRLGLATPGELAAFWAAISPADAKAWCERKAGKDIQEVEIEAADGTKPWKAYAPHDVEDILCRIPTTPSRVRFLSPFDPVIRDRRRSRRLFNFDYRFEAFVPESQRQYGYYVLPMLERDRFIGRVNLKFVRSDQTLAVKGLWLEPGVRRTKTREQHIAEALARFCVFLGAERYIDEKT